MLLFDLKDVEEKPYTKENVHSTGGTNRWRYSKIEGEK